MGEEKRESASSRPREPRFRPLRAHSNPTEKGSHCRDYRREKRSADLETSRCERAERSKRTSRYAHARAREYGFTSVMCVSATILITIYITLLPICLFLAKRAGVTDPRGRPSRLHVAHSASLSLSSSPSLTLALSHLPSFLREYFNLLQTRN